MGVSLSSQPRGLLDRCSSYSDSVRSFIFRLRQDTLLAELKAKLSRVQAHKFTILELEPHLKDGGVFVHFKYALPDRGEEDSNQTENSEDPHPIDSTSSTTSKSGDQTPQERRVLHELERLLNEEADNAGGLPSWNGIRRGNVWLVQGSPWREVRISYPVVAHEP